jgi:uncharacterized SAM-binding protein YcdF (DUF218 family)
MNAHLFRRRMVLFPTLLGWTCLLALAAAVVSLWCFDGESFLSLTERRPAEILVVEGWIGATGLRGAAAEFSQGGYRYVVTTGGLADDRWNLQRWSYVDAAGRILMQAGVPQDKILPAPSEHVERQRTYQTAVAARQALEARGIQPQALNVFTLGSHARRSRLVFAKVFGATTNVGVISWEPPGSLTERWWLSSERSEDMLKETVGYAFELLLNSGRWSNAPAPQGSPGKKD